MGTSLNRKRAKRTGTPVAWRKEFLTARPGYRPQDAEVAKKNSKAGNHSKKSAVAIRFGGRNKLNRMKNVELLLASSAQAKPERAVKSHCLSHAS